MRRWVVIDTPMYPARWKVTYLRDGQDAGGNGTSNYFRDESEAWAEANLRNAREDQS